MTLLLTSVLLSLAVSVWVILPLVQRRLALTGDAVPGAILDADARKRVALAALREVEYDRIGGKLDDADYAKLKAQLEREALAALETARAVHEGESARGDFVVTHSCGFQNPAGSRFCSGCGRPLGGGRAGA